MYSREQIKGLAAEADAALLRAKDALANQTGDHHHHHHQHQQQQQTPQLDDSANSIFQSVDYALTLQRSYRVALWAVLEQQKRPFNDRNNNDGTNLQQPLIEGILLSLVTTIWLYGKQNDLEKALSVVSHEVQKLVSMSRHEPLATLTTNLDDDILNTPQHILEELESILSKDNHAFTIFAHSWKVARWIQEKSTVVEETCLETQTDGSETRPSQEVSESNELQDKQTLFRAIVLDHQIRNECLSEEQLQQKCKMRDQCLDPNSLAGFQHQFTSGSDFSAVTSKMRELQCLFRATDALNPGNNLEPIDDEAIACMRDILCTSSNDAAVLNMIGCVLARSNNNIKHALESFHKSLRIDPERQETIANVVECFLRLGDPARAKVLLLCLLRQWPTGEQRAATCSKIMPSHYYMIQAVHFSSDANRMRLLWWIFLVASLNEDTETMLQSANDMKADGILNHVQAFALLQSGRPSSALEWLGQEGGLTTNVTQTDSSMGELRRTLWTIVCSLYEADCQIELSESAGVANVASLSEKAVSCYQSISADEALRSVHQNGLLACTIYNNRGISHILEQNVESALECFQAACSAVRKELREANARWSYAFFQPFFNLTLVYWRECKVKDAIETWVDGRGIDLQSLGVVDLETMLNESMESFVEFSDNNDTERVCLPSLHVPSWRPRNVGNREVRLMDCIILLGALERRQSEVLSRWVSEEAVH